MLPPIFNAKANPLPPYEYPEITISSPIPDKTYNTSSIPLNIKIQVFAYTYQSIEKIKILNYSLDGFQATPIEPIYPREYGPGYFISANSQLNSLTEGSHTLLIQGETTYNKHFQKNITFTVDTSKHSISEQSHTSTFTPKSQQSLQLPSTTEIVAIVILIVIALGLAVNIVKKRRS
jgi:hypothetical protein